MIRTISGTTRRGATAVEYGLIIAVLSLAIVGGVGYRRQFIAVPVRATTTASSAAGIHSKRQLAAVQDLVNETSADPGLSGFCCEACGAQPDIQTSEKVALIRPSGSEKRSA